MFNNIIVILLVSISGIAHANISDDDYATLELVYFASYDCRIEIQNKNAEADNCKIMRKYMPEYKSILIRPKIVNNINTDSRVKEIAHYIKYITKDLQEISEYKKLGAMP